MSAPTAIFGSLLIIAAFFAVYRMLSKVKLPPDNWDGWDEEDWRG